MLKEGGGHTRSHKKDTGTMHYEEGNKIKAVLENEKLHITAFNLIC